VKVITRSGFVKRGAVAVGALVVPGIARAKGGGPVKTGNLKTLPVYRLDAISTRCGGGKTACRSCKKHDANSLFPTRKAAGGNRAHIGCDCCVRAGTLDYGTWVAIFGNPRKQLKLYRADRRDPRIKALLKAHPPVFP
jgi:hypothetical protein